MTVHATSKPYLFRRRQFRPAQSPHTNPFFDAPEPILHLTHEKVYFFRSHLPMPVGALCEKNILTVFNQVGSLAKYAYPRSFLPVRFPLGK